MKKLIAAIILNTIVAIVMSFMYGITRSEVFIVLAIAAALNLSMLAYFGGNYDTYK